VNVLLTILAVVGAWFVVSIVLGLFFGRGARRLR
jgi:hypothetical protein